MEHVAVEHSRESSDRSNGAFRIPVPLCVPCSNARIEHGIVESEKQLYLVVELIVIAFSDKLSELIP